MKIKPQVLSQLRRIKILICDVDGVLTDGSIYIGGAQEIKRFDIQDGLGMVLFRRAGLKIGWVSSRPSAATGLRARELKIDFLVQQKDRPGKVASVEKLLKRAGLTWPEACYVGDDIVDLGPLKRAGVGVSVANGTAEVRAAADVVTRAAGGHGAVREVIEMILKAQGKWASYVAYYTE